jgi:hypothetical protein
VTLPTAVALSYVVGDDIEIGVNELIDRMTFPRVAPEALVAMARADSALEWAGVSRLLPLHKLFVFHRDSLHFKAHDERTEPDPSMDSLLLRAIRALGDTTSLPPSRRSAALLAADIAVQVHSHWLDYKGPDTLWRAELEQAGVSYGYDQLGATYVYLRPWLWRAYQLDSLGPAGKSAFAELLR